MSIKGSANSFIELRGRLSIPEAIQGKSAYEIALLNGFEGTEAEWLDSLTQETADKAEAMIKETKEAALNEIETEGGNAVETINVEKNGAIATIGAKEREAVTAVSNEKAEALTAIGDGKAEALTAIDNRESEALKEISDNKDVALTAINAKVTEAANSAAAAQTAATNAKASETAAQTEANRAEEAANNAASNAQNAIKEAKESGEFDGADGKSAYAFAQDGGYEGTEEEFAKCLAAMPDCSGKYIANDTIVIGQHTVSGQWSVLEQDIEVGALYAVYINGTEYFCIAGDNGGAIYLGNITLMDGESTQPHNNEPFCIVWGDQSVPAGPFFKDATLSDPITLKVTGASVTGEKKLPVEYLPDDVALKSDIPEGGGGADIDVVAEVGQTIVVEEVDADGKPTKWKAAEYQERTHWKTETVILPETTAEYSEEDGSFLIPFVELIGGAQHKIVYNGVEYVSEIFDAREDGVGEILFGNIPIMMETGDNGIPFMGAMTTDGESSIGIVVPTDGAESVTISITQVEYTPIPVQYVTNAFPYYIEIIGSGTEDDPYVCNDTVENVKAIYESGRDIKVRRLDGSASYVEGYLIYNMLSVYKDSLYIQLVFGAVSNSYIILSPNKDNSFTVGTSLD